MAPGGPGGEILEVACFDEEVSVRPEGLDTTPVSQAEQSVAVSFEAESTLPSSHPKVDSIEQFDEAVRSGVCSGLRNMGKTALQAMRQEVASSLSLSQTEQAERIKQLAVNGKKMQAAKAAKQEPAKESLPEKPGKEVSADNREVRDRSAERAVVQAAATTEEKIRVAERTEQASKKQPAEVVSSQKIALRPENVEVSKVKPAAATTVKAVPKTAGAARELSQPKSEATAATRYAPEPQLASGKTVPAAGQHDTLPSLKAAEGTPDKDAATDSTSTIIVHERPDEPMELIVKRQEIADDTLAGYDDTVTDSGEGHRAYLGFEQVQAESAAADIAGASVRAVSESEVPAAADGGADADEAGVFVESASTGLSDVARGISPELHEHTSNFAETEADISGTDMDETLVVQSGEPIASSVPVTQERPWASPLAMGRTDRSAPEGFAADMSEELAGRPAFGRYFAEVTAGLVPGSGAGRTDEVIPATERGAVAAETLPRPESIDAAIPVETEAAPVTFLGVVEAYATRYVAPEQYPQLTERLREFYNLVALVKLQPPAAAVSELAAVSPEKMLSEQVEAAARALLAELGSENAEEALVQASIAMAETDIAHMAAQGIDVPLWLDDSLHEWKTALSVPDEATEDMVHRLLRHLGKLGILRHSIPTTAQGYALAA